MRIFRNWLGPTNKVEADLTDELTDYVHRETERNIARGLPPDEARTIALREIGGIEVVKEACRDVRASRPFEMFAQDLRYGLRQLRKNPGFALSAALTFALGIGSNATIFTTVNAILLRPPAVQQPARLMVLLSQKPGTRSTRDEDGRMPVSALDFLDWQAQAKSFSGMAASNSKDFTVGNPDGAERVAGDLVSPNYFKVLGVNPILGRGFVTGEDQAGHNAIVLLSENLWKQSFGAQRDIVGRQVRIDGEPHTVIGILPESFRRGWLSEARIWVPLTFRPEEQQPKARAERFLRVFARLKPGTPEAAATAELNNIGTRLAQTYSDTDRGWGATLMPVQKFAQAEGNATKAVLFLQGTVLFVLLIACANVVNLLLARNSMRQREFAIRASLGAGGFRLARQLLTECLLLGTAGALGGLLFASVAVKLIRSQFTWNDVASHMAESLTIDSNVLLFTCAISLMASLIAGLAPVFQTQRVKVAAALKESSRNATGGKQHQRAQKLLVVGEVVLSMGLLTGAGLFVADFVQSLKADPGFDPHGVLTASISLSGRHYESASEQIFFFQKLLNETSHSPEVASAAITSTLPFSYPQAARIATAEQDLTQPERESEVGSFSVSSGYFKTAQIPLVQGREFTVFDNSQSSPVAIVNQAFSAKFFPSENPIGRRIYVTHQYWHVGAPLQPSVVVGVVRNVNEMLGQTHPRPQVYQPFLQQSENSMAVLVRLRTEPRSFTSSLRRIVSKLDPDQPVANMRTMEHVIEDSSQGTDLMAGLMSAFAAVALAMAAFGIYGLLAYIVAGRTQELGVRMAMGASRGDVLALVLRRSLAFTLAGVGIGIAFAFPIPKLLTAVFGTVVEDSWLIVSASPVLLTITSILASYLPARRACRVDPMIALRSD